MGQIIFGHLFYIKIINGYDIYILYFDAVFLFSKIFVIKTLSSGNRMFKFCVTAIF